MANTSATLQSRQQFSFCQWMKLQEVDLSEMLQALDVQENGGDTDALLRNLIERNIEHFQGYAQDRVCLAHDHVSPFFAPPWCSSVEASLLWIAGCRPSIFIRLIYALSGEVSEVQMRELLEGAGTSCLGELAISAKQLTMINHLHCRTIKDEGRLSDEMASLNEKIADHPIAIIAKQTSEGSRQNPRAHEALNDHSKSLLRLLEEADKLRIGTLKQLLNILRPVQGVDFLIAAKKLHICVHEWGKKRDLDHIVNFDV